MYTFLNRYLSIQTVLIQITEVYMIFSALLLAITMSIGFNISWDISSYLPLILFMTIVYIATYYYFGLYNMNMYHFKPQMIVRLLVATITGSLILYLVFHSMPASWKLFLFVTIILFIFLLLCRFFFTWWLSHKLMEDKVLIIGSGEMAKKIGTEIYHRKKLGFKLVGFIDENPANIGKAMVNPRVIGCFDDISNLVTKEKITRIIVALSDKRTKLPMTALLDCKLNGINVEEGETFFERMMGKVLLDNLKPSWMIFSDGFEFLRSRKIIKRIFDIIFSVFLLILSSPLLLLTPLLIKLESAGPLLFRQIRVGENGKEFEIYKFRSMLHDAEVGTGPVWADKEDKRVTRVGSIIRKLRIDELPQLINVIKGDMSFIGPRPERPFFVEQLKKDIPYYNIRLIVKPGLTGWAQVCYPYGATVTDAIEKLQYDIYYIKNMNPILDFMIIMKTIKVVFTGGAISIED